MPPLVEANCVNQELERPHMVTKGNKYYLFTDTHLNKFAPGTSGPKGLFGFVPDSLVGSYQPLNDSGLVVANPKDKAKIVKKKIQVYSNKFHLRFRRYARA